MVTVITGLILSGKTTLAKCLTTWGYKSVLEYTTRPKRDGEYDGIDYHFIDGEQFDAIQREDEFAETMQFDTVFGTWKYGAKKKDLKDGCILVCGPVQAQQIVDSDVPALIVLLDIDKDEALKRAALRCDNFEEFERRFENDTPDVEMLKPYADLVLDASADKWKNAVEVDKLVAGQTGTGYRRTVDGHRVITAQLMNDRELNLYLSGDTGLEPYLRMRGQGMPNNLVDQIAWLLLQSSGCGFCKVCRKEPCQIKDGERCTKNIANYIRDCVHAEDAAQSGK